MTTIDWAALVQDREAWVTHNFPTQDLKDPMTSMMGMIEETGELAHAWLKMHQGIRGTEQEHLRNMEDAVGDITIYMLGVMSAYGAPDALFKPRPRGDKPEELILLLATEVGSLIDDITGRVGERWAQENMEEIISTLGALCRVMGWRFEEVVTLTWESVASRDWIKYPDTGRAPNEGTAQELGGVELDPHGVLPDQPVA